MSPSVRRPFGPLFLAVLAVGLACESTDDASSPADLPSDGTSGQGGMAPSPPSETSTGPGGSPGPNPDNDGGSPSVPSDVGPVASAGAGPGPVETSGSAGGTAVGGSGAAGMPATSGGAASGGTTSGGSAGSGGSATSGGANAGGSGGAGDPCAVLDDFEPPTLLSQTGLYSDTAAGTLAEGVRSYEPRYELWSDGAVKSRWVYIPPCGPIDTSDPDYWQYPVGFKLWKQFDRLNAAGELVRVETRLLHKYTATKWFMTAFIWNEAQTDAAVAEVDGPTALVAAENAKGTDHDVPGQKGCEGCHFNMLDKALGFTALQLDHETAPDGYVTLAELEAEGLLSSPIARPITVPGTPEQAEALGYIHANCGHCHNPYAKQASLNMQLWLQLDTLGAVETTDTYATTVGIANQAPQQPELQPDVRVVPGNLEESALYWRMTQPPVYPTSPEGGDHMPLIGTEITHEAGVQLVADWIESLPALP